MFFATKDDLLPVLAFAERAGALKYIRTGLYSSPHFESFARGQDIPGLWKGGLPICGRLRIIFSLCNGFDNKNRHRQSDGIDRYFVDQLLNPDSVTLSPGGAWNPDIYLKLGTASATEASKQLMKRFRAGIRKYFVTIGAYYVGPEARKLLTEGKRLTIAQQSPPEFDLIIPNAGS